MGNPLDQTLRLLWSVSNIKTRSNADAHLYQYKRMLWTLLFFLFWQVQVLFCPMSHRLRLHVFGKVWYEAGWQVGGTWRGNRFWIVSDGADILATMMTFLSSSFWNWYPLSHIYRLKSCQIHSHQSYSLQLKSDDILFSFSSLNCMKNGSIFNLKRFL